MRVILFPSRTKVFAIAQHLGKCAILIAAFGLVFGIFGTPRSLGTPIWNLLLEILGSLLMTPHSPITAGSH